VTIDILPDGVLLEIFGFYVGPMSTRNELETWCTLVHVCQKWRNVVFESPLRLDLRISCHPTTPVREKLDIWPSFPIVINQSTKWQPTWGTDNTIAALEQNDRICKINLSDVPGPQMGEILAAMHKPFPVLTDLRLISDDETVSVDFDLFLGGSAPCLRSLHLFHIPLPGLPNLLFSATHLTDLRLFKLSHSGYISPEAMVSCFFALTRLESLILTFESLESFPVWEHRCLPPPSRTLLPALTRLYFFGISEYLDDLVDRIDTPLLDDLGFTLFHQLIPYTSQLAQFINRTPKLEAHNEAHVFFCNWGVQLAVHGESGKGLAISYEVEDWPVSSLALVCTSSLSHALSATVELLHIYDDHESLQGDIQVEKEHWLELLRPFTSVKSLLPDFEPRARLPPAYLSLTCHTVSSTLYLTFHT
jgi:hypothetical protein